MLIKEVILMKQIKNKHDVNSNSKTAVDYVSQ